MAGGGDVFRAAAEALEVMKNGGGSTY